MSDSNIAKLRLKKEAWCANGCRISTRTNGEGYVVTDLITRKYHILNASKEILKELYPEN